MTPVFNKNKSGPATCTANRMQGNGFSHRSWVCIILRERQLIKMIVRYLKCKHSPKYFIFQLVDISLVY